MKNYFKLSNEELLCLLREEISCKRYDNALIIWGMISFDCDDEKKYFLSVILFGKGQTKEGIYWAKQITVSPILEAAELKILEAYAKSGRIEEFFDYFINTFSGSLGFIEFMNYIYEVMYASKYYMYAETERIDKMIAQILESPKLISEIRDEKEVYMYWLYTIQFMGLFIEAFRESEEIYEEKNIEGSVNSIAKALGLYNMISNIFPPFAEEFQIEDFINDYKGTVTRFLNRAKVAILEMEEFDYKWIIYYSTLERIADEKLLIDEIYSGIDRFSIFMDKYGYSVMYPLFSAYAKAVAFEDDRAIIFEKLLNQCKIPNDAMGNAVIYEKVKKYLSVKSEIAYKSACSLYVMAKNNEYEHKDGGPISLAFYRIIELESNTVIWEPIIKKVTVVKLKECFNNLNNNDKEKWKILLKTFKKMENNGDVGLMIGNLRVLMRNLKGSDDLAMILRKEFINMLTEKGIEAFENGKIDEWYSEENAMKFRNPPAHAKYLHFDTVEECKRYVETQIQNMGKWLKK